jgi:hypothetical protein
MQMPAEQVVNVFVACERRELDKLRAAAETTGVQTDLTAPLRGAAR